MRRGCHLDRHAVQVSSAKPCTCPLKGGDGARGWVVGRRMGLLSRGAAVRQRVPDRERFLPGDAASTPLPDCARTLRPAIPVGSGPVPYRASPRKESFSIDDTHSLAWRGGGRSCVRAPLRESAAFTRAADYWEVGRVTLDDNGACVGWCSMFHVEHQAHSR